MGVLGKDNPLQHYYNFIPNMCKVMRKVGLMKCINKFKGINEYCMTCTKSCKQFENVKVVVCPNRNHIASVTPSMDKHEKIGL